MISIVANNHRTMSFAFLLKYKSDVMHLLPPSHIVSALTEI